MNGQLQLDLFPTPAYDHEAEWRKWLREPFNDIDDEGMEVFDRLCKRYRWNEATERSKCLVVVYGRKKIDSLTVDDLGLFTADDYHTCWDRKWAALNGVPVDRVREVREWDYGKKEPIYADAH